MSGGGTAGHVFPALAVAERLRAAGHDVRFVGSADGPGSSARARGGVPVRAGTGRAGTDQAVPAHREGALALAGRGSRGAPAGAVVRRGRGHRGVRERAGHPRRTPNAHADRADRTERGAGRGEPAGRAVGARGGHHLRGHGRSAPGRHPHRAHRQPDPRAIAEVAASREQRRHEALREFDLEDAPPHGLGLRREPGCPGARSHGGRHDRGLRDRDDLQLLVATGPAHLEEVAPAARRRASCSCGWCGSSTGSTSRSPRPTSPSRGPGRAPSPSWPPAGCPSILVPYPHATEHHQEANAREVERAGGAEVVLEPALDPAMLAQPISGSWPTSGRRARMREAMLRVGAPGRRRTHRRARGGGGARERLPPSRRQHPHPAGPFLGWRRLGAPDRGRRRRHAQPRPAAARARHRRPRLRHQGLEGARRARRGWGRGLGGPRSPPGSGLPTS